MLLFLAAWFLFLRSSCSSRPYTIFCILSEQKQNVLQPILLAHEMNLDSLIIRVCKNSIAINICGKEPKSMKLAKEMHF